MIGVLHDHRRRRLGGERGTALVEMAMVLPIALALMLGIFTGGSAYFRKISLVDASREGARYGASLKVPSGGVTVWRQQVKDRVVQLSGGELAAADICVDLVVPTGTNTVCGVNDPTGASTDPSVLLPASIVKISVSKTARIEYLFSSSNVTLSAKIAARYERDII